MNADITGTRERGNAGTRAAVLPCVFFSRNTVDVARDLIGHLLIHETREGRLVGRIVEAEAYRGPRDPASHAYRRTPRSRIMWARPGTAYVYFTYGNHYCLNVVCEPEGIAGAVLLRALEPLEGLNRMRSRRGVDDPRGLAGGPGRLTQALGIGPQHNGHDLTAPPLYLAQGDTTGIRVRASARIGISAATGRRWRFLVDGSPFVSRR
ncbi:MAG: DNA-3-methyladenine glycosylase [bacterium]